MENRELINKLKRVKEERGFTLYELSKNLDVQISTVSRWFKTNRINRVYARLVRDKFDLD